ncbi:hypothetical protein StoSoilB3_42180 (plasmid) [Arthrobacter sp. StoSoilB3]|nr:hypothetical protein StoSoilB3_42180 [Arthrobacter sp. StoSoilB3]
MEWNQSVVHIMPSRYQPFHDPFRGAPDLSDKLSGDIDTLEEPEMVQIRRESDRRKRSWARRQVAGDLRKLAIASRGNRDLLPG